ncbi:ribonuclease P protein component [Segnochrobactrum spirostomi]|uniref:Ribonuclease P protein component n=1 Tax=Segnochrobactrum spirostomi TaxID=2608987 RepID=A0A6A7Y3F3_9HYPH|nr:ribonuclease P protein component [Segnochrobactrum spirostomi]MQT12907.1 ribonuclease P protein component [Segnochrobactrum spirostomi]
MTRLKKRAEFVAAAKGSRTERRAFVVQARPRGAGTTTDDVEPARFGFTVTKRTVAKAVERNRIRRRLRAAASACAPKARLGCDYVLIGRPEALTIAFADLVGDLAGALERLDRALDPSRGGKAGRSTAKRSERPGGPAGPPPETRR